MKPVKWATSLPKLTINNHVKERQQFIKFLGVLLKKAKKTRTTLQGKTLFRERYPSSSLLFIFAYLLQLSQHSLTQPRVVPAG